MLEYAPQHTMSLTLLHNGLSNACLIFSLILGGYAMWSFFRQQNLSGGFLGALVIAELLYLSQALVGVTLALQGGVPARGWVHYLYGVVMLISLPGLYAFVRGRDTRREALMYAVAGLFLAGISLRAMTTATTVLP
jgi:hypothetical protein